MKAESKPSKNSSKNKTPEEHAAARKAAQLRKKRTSGSRRNGTLHREPFDPSKAAKAGGSRRPYASVDPVEAIADGLRKAIGRLNLNYKERVAAEQFADLLTHGVGSRSGIFKEVRPHAKMRVEKLVLQRFATTCWMKRHILADMVLPGMERFSSRYRQYYRDAMAAFPTETSEDAA